MKRGLVLLLAFALVAGFAAGNLSQHMDGIQSNLSRLSAGLDLEQSWRTVSDEVGRWVGSATSSAGDLVGGVTGSSGQLLGEYASPAATAVWATLQGGAEAGFATLKGIATAAGIDLSIVVALITFSGAALGILGIYSGFIREPELARQRIERHEARAIAEVGSAAMPILLKDRRLSAINWMDRLLRRTDFAGRMALDLARAAVPLRVAEYFFLRWSCGLAAAMFALMLGQAPLVALLAGGLGFLAPRFYLSRRCQSRINQITHQLMDAMNLIASSLRSGYSFTQGLEVVTREMPPPISEEFYQVLVELNMGASAEEALGNLAKRVPSYDIDLLVTALVIQRNVGGNLAEVLENIAQTIRERIRILGEVRTRTAQARLSGYIVGLMPFALMGIISFLNPAYLAEMAGSPTGVMMLGVAVAMEILGFFVIRRIVAIEV